MKAYPKCNTKELLLKVLPEFGIKPDRILDAILEAEIKRYKEIVLTFPQGKIDVDPYPKEFIEASDVKTGKKYLLVLFENPLKYVEIIDEDGNTVKDEDKSFIGFFDLVVLAIDRENPEKSTISLITPGAYKKIKSTPIEYFVQEDNYERYYRSSMDN